MLDEDMPFLLMLREAHQPTAPTVPASVGAPGKPIPVVDNALVRASLPVECSNPMPASRRTAAPDVVQMTPALWERGNYLHRLNNDFSLDLSQSMAMRVVSDQKELDILLEFSDDTEGWGRTDQLPFLSTRIFSRGADDDSSSSFVSLSALENEEGPTPVNRADEIRLDTHALAAVEIESECDGLRSRSFRTSGSSSLLVREFSNPHLVIAATEDSRTVDTSGVETVSAADVACDVALEVLERDSRNNLGAEFDARVRADFEQHFEADLEVELRNALGTLEEEAVEDAAIEEEGRRPASLRRSPFVERDWEFASTVQEEKSQHLFGDVHQLSTELGAHNDSARGVPRSKRLTRRQRQAAKKSKKHVATLAVRHLPWESFVSSTGTDTGWQAPDDLRPLTLTAPSEVPVDELRFDDERTAPISTVAQRDAHSRARTLFLGAVSHYRAGAHAAAHTDALLACVYDPDNPTYRVMANRWAQELISPSSPG